MEREAKLGRRDAALVVSKRVPVRVSEIGGVIGPSFGEVYAHLGAHGVIPHGPPFVIYHGDPASGDPFDIEICAPVSVALIPPVGWQLQELPAGSFATQMHVGPYGTLGETYAALAAWIAGHGLEAAGPPREVYLSPPETPPDQIRTVIELPVEEVAAPVAVG